jgi:hypothetical protein
MKRCIVICLLFILATGSSGYYLFSIHHELTAHNTEVHVHSDFLVVINDTKISFTDERYQSSITQTLHPHVHLHDGEDHVVHRHAEGITFSEFLESLGYTLTNECLTTSNDSVYCADTDNVLALYVNNIPKTIITEYVPNEEDKILLYYGTPDNPNLSTYLNMITDEACIYSGTCPERGMAPAESCGLTCEL